MEVLGVPLLNGPGPPLEMGECWLLHESAVSASGSEVGRVMAGISNLKSSSPKLGAWNVCK